MHLGNRPPDAAWPLLLLLFLLVRADILPKRIDPLPQSREVFTCLLRPPRSRRGLGLSGPPPCPTSEAGACLGRDAASSSNPPGPGAGRPAATHSERAEAEQHVHRLDDLRQGIRPAGDRDLVPAQAQAAGIVPRLQFFQQELLVALDHLLVSVLPHHLDPVVHRHGEAVEAVVMGEGAPVTGDAGHLVEELVLQGLFHRHPLGAVVVPDDHVPVHHQLVLAHDGLQGVDDAGLLLFAVLHLLDMAGVVAGEVGADEPGEHAVTEVGLDDHAVDLLFPGQLDDGLEGLLGVAVRVGPDGRQVEEAVEHLQHHYGGLVGAPAGRVDGHDGPGVRDPRAGQERGGMIPVAVQTDAGQVI